MNTPVKVTVITVVYNGLKDIEETMLSVLNQTFPSIEYIVIDGGSTDGTVDIIKRYADRLTFWLTEPDNGIYFAMNKGIKLATGDWIHFRNCGDYFYNEHAISDFFSKPVKSGIAVLYGDCRFVYKNGYVDLKPPILTRTYKQGMPIFHPSTFVRSYVHKEIPFNTLYKSSADYEFVFKCFELGYKFEYRPLLVSIYNSIEGFSVLHWKLARKEIWDWKYNDFILKSFVIWFDIFIISCRKKCIGK